MRFPWEELFFFSLLIHWLVLHGKLQMITSWHKVQKPVPDTFRRGHSASLFLRAASHEVSMEKNVFPTQDQMALSQDTGTWAVLSLITNFFSTCFYGLLGIFY